VTTDKYVLSFDPGVSNGIALVGYNDDSVWLVKAWQFSGGAGALTRWLSRNWVESGWNYYHDEPEYAHLVIRDGAGESLYAEPHANYGYLDEYGNPAMVEPTLTVIAEKFTARNTKGFSYTTASLEPLRGEGVLIAKGVIPDYQPGVKEWRDPKYQYVVGGKDKDDKKKRLHAFLKDSGEFYVTGAKHLDGAPNADDARSAIGHALSYLAKTRRHKPTFEMISAWGEENGGDT